MNRLLAVACALLIAAVDQVTKFTAQSQLGGLPEGQAAILIPELLYLKPTSNSGGFWGAFQGLPPWFFVVLSVFFVIFVTVLIVRLADDDKSYLPALGLALGGFLGNGIDRVRFGAVTDFIHFSGYPAWLIAAFNLADLAILVGIVAITVRFFLTRRAGAARQPEPHSEEP